jgi:multidrug efflux pump subunit AcrA (membrane-fusion protein)
MQITKLRVVVLFLLVGALASGGVIARNPLAAAPPQPGTDVPPNGARGQEGGGKKPQPVAVQVMKPWPGGLDAVTRQPCTVQAFESVLLHAAVSGYLQKQTVDIGDRVKKAELLAEIDAPLLTLDAKRAALAVKRAQAKVEEAEAQVHAAKAEALAAEKVVQQRQAEVVNAKAKATFSQRQLERFKELEKRKTVEATLVQEKEQSLEAARALVAAAMASLENAQAYVKVKQSEMARAGARLKIAQANQDVVQVALKKAQVLVEYSNIKAPFDGIVSQRSLHVGDFVRAATDSGAPVPLLTVQRTDLFRAVVQIPDRAVPYCDPGNPAQVEIDALPGKKFSAKVSRVGGAVDPTTRLMRVEIDIPNPKAMLRPGMYGTATILLRKASPQALRVPASSLIRMHPSDRPALYIVRNDKAYLTPVQTGTDDGKEVEVLSGLNPGDRVVIDPRGLTGTMVPVGVKRGPTSADIPKLPPGSLPPLILP